MADIIVEKDEGSSSVSNNNYIPGKPYSNIRRELTDEDLSNPAVQKLLLNEIDKLEMLLAKHDDLQKQFHIIDKEKSVLEEKQKTNTSGEVIYGFCLAIGSGLMGLSSLSRLNDLWWIFFLVGGILTIGGILSRYIKWK